MKLIFVTQVLDRGDAVLGFVVRWIEGLAREAESLRVVALEVGDVAGLPANVDVREVGRKGYLGRYLRYQGFLREAFGEGFDGLLTHMVPRYSTLAARRARSAGAAHYLWYTHKGVDRRLLSALRVVDGAFTASDLSLRVDTPKKIVTGHGIDLAHFDVEPVERRSHGGPLRLLSVGRLTPAKDPLTVIGAVAALCSEGLDVTLTWAGGGLAKGDTDYEATVRRTIADHGLDGVVELTGAVPYPRIPAMYAAADVLINASGTGSVDKVVLEAMAARIPFVSCNESIPPVLSVSEALQARVDDFRFDAGDTRSLAQVLRRWRALPREERRVVGEELRKVVAEHHEVDALMARLVRTMGER